MPSFQELPIIDISIFVTDFEKSGLSKEEYTNKKLEVSQQLHAACKEVGFFYVKGHQIDPTFLQQVQDLARQFFALPQEEKDKITIRNSAHFRGYQKLGQNVTKYAKDWHEAIDLYKNIPKENPLSKEGTVHGPNQWPSNPAPFKQMFEEYVQNMLSLGSAIMRCMALGLGLDENFFVSKFTNDSYWCMRVIGYPPLNTSNGIDGVGVSCGEHTDYGCLTVVFQDSTKNALEVKNKDGQWIAANPIPGAFVMNLGDMIRVWTNGMYQSTPHRVVNAGSNYRVSIPFFYEPNFDAVIEPLKECCVEKPAIFSPIMFGNHLTSKVTTNFDWQHEKLNK